MPLTHALTWVIAMAGLLAGCTGPLGPIRGGRLAGSEVAEPVRDWSFAERYRLMQLEARPGDPYSVNVHFVVAAGQLYIDIGQPDDFNRWRRLVRQDPNVRVRFGERVYRARLAPVRAADELARVVESYRRKHGGAPPADATFARIDPR